jgi:stage IV sporulation protein FA
MKMDMYQKYYQNKKAKPKKITKYLTKILFSIIFFLLSLIFIKSSNSNHDLYEQYFFTDSMSFARLNDWYQKHFGNVIPIDDVTETNSEPVFNETLSYETMDNYLNGKLLTVSNNYMVPTLNSGVVVFLGNKDGYGNTCIIQGVDGVDIWYGNLNTDNINLYDYIKKGTFIGPTNSTNLYLVFMKDNNYISYEEYMAS